MNPLALPPRAARDALLEWLAARGEPPYRLGQILPRLWLRPVAAWADATDLPRALREALDAEWPLARPRLAARQVSRDGTVKYLWEFPDQGLVESVAIPERRRRTLCISSQAGCAYGCVFCATGRMGFVRHLAEWEIASQVREILLEPEGVLPTNIVFMGMGEPLHNWANVDRALSILNDPDGFGIGARHITVSTIGLVPALHALADRPEQFRVALSLHGATTAVRGALMPIERKYPLERVLEALERFPRRVTFEYVLIHERNDRPEDADRLAVHARRLKAHVNLLPLNPGGAPDLQPTPASGIRAFGRRLKALGVNVTVRRSRGLDISAACGQLRVEVTRRRVGAQDHAHVQ